jgi:autotransporter-associated beta strand protein
VTNDVYLSNNTTSLGFWNSLIFTGAVNATLGGTVTVNTVNPVTVDFKQGIGETFAATALTKQGFGKLIFSGAATYSGGTTISPNSGALILRDQGTALNTTFTVGLNDTLELDNDFGANLPSRIGDTATIALNGGTLTFIGQSGAASTEAVGTITLGSNFSNTIQSIVNASNAGSSAVLTVGSLTRNAGAFVKFQGFGANLGSAANQVVFTTAPNLAGSAGNAILLYATVQSAAGLIDLATHSGNGTSITAFTNYSTGDINAAAAGTNYLMTSNQTLTSASKTLNAIVIRGTGLTLAPYPGRHGRHYADDRHGRRRRPRQWRRRELDHR